MGWFGRKSGTGSDDETSTSSPSSSAAAAPPPNAAAARKAEAAAVALQSALESAVEEATMKLVIPLQKRALLCAAGCCDSSRTRKQLEECSESCVPSVRGAEMALSLAVEKWQRGFTQALEQCHRDHGSDRGDVDDCVRAAAERFKDAVPQLRKTIREAVPKAAEMARRHHEGRRGQES